MTVKYRYTPTLPTSRRYASPLGGRFFSEHLMPDWMISSFALDEEDDFLTTRNHSNSIFTKEIQS